MNTKDKKVNITKTDSTPTSSSDDSKSTPTS